MKHQCHARGCTRTCAPKFLMCPPHWAMVPWHIQRAVKEHFVSAQCRLGSGVRPSNEWFNAARAAIEAVYQLEESRRPDSTGGGK